jgi:hypothetical protein
MSLHYHFDYPDKRGLNPRPEQFRLAWFFPDPTIGDGLVDKKRGDIWARARDRATQYHDGYRTYGTVPVPRMP